MVCYNLADILILILSVFDGYNEGIGRELIEQYALITDFPQLDSCLFNFPSHVSLTVQISRILKV